MKRPDFGTIKLYAIDYSYAPQCGYETIVGFDIDEPLDIALILAHDYADEVCADDPLVDEDDALGLALSYYSPTYETTALDVMNGSAAFIQFRWPFEPVVHSCTRETLALVIDEAYDQFVESADIMAAWREELD
jgi:hypothetical protein